MTAARDRAQCQRLDRWLTAYVDGELDAVHVLDVEDHLERCERCREHAATLRATQVSLRRVCALKAPDTLRERLVAKLHEDRAAEADAAADEDRAASVGSTAPAAASRADEPERETVPPGRRESARLRYIVPLAAAATVALVFGAMHLQQREEEATLASAARVQEAPLDRLVDDLVTQHVQPMPPETTDPDSLERFDPFVGVRVRPPQFDNARFVGARIMSRRAALLQHVLRDRHRVTVYVFDPGTVPLRSNRLESRHLGKSHVYVGHIRGFSVAASERNGIGYALASDLSDDESAQLLVAAR
jgi:anti-sigma factor RsiW